MRRIFIFVIFVFSTCCMGMDMTNMTSIESVAGTKVCERRSTSDAAKKTERPAKEHAPNSSLSAKSTVKMKSSTKARQPSMSRTPTTRRYKLRPHKRGSYDFKRVLSLHSELATFGTTYTGRETSEYDQKPEGGHRNITLSIESTTQVMNARKTYPPRIVRREILRAHLTTLFSEFDEEKRAFFKANTENSTDRSSTCYFMVTNSFAKYCYYEYFYKGTGMKDVRDLLSRACKASWLTTKKIIRILRNCCGKRFRYWYDPLPREDDAHGNDTHDDYSWEHDAPRIKENRTTDHTRPNLY